MSVDQPSAPAASVPPTVPPAAALPTWEPLTLNERRALGVLIEKQKTSKTADSYPLTLNALTSGCNQKSNREPVLELSDDDVEETLTALQKKGLVMRMTGGRVDRFRHLLYDVWTKNGPELAVLAELLLRGPQTKGELRGRAGRMDAIDTLDALDGILKSLAARRLVVHLGDPDRRGALVTHGFHFPDELGKLATYQASAPASAESPAPRHHASPDTLALLEAKVSELAADLSRTNGAIAVLTQRLAELEARLSKNPAAT